MRRYTIHVNDRPFVLHVSDLAPDRFRVDHEGISYAVELVSEDEVGGIAAQPLAEPLPKPAAAAPVPGPVPGPASAADGQDPRLVAAPMPGLILAVEARPGLRVRRGDVLVKLEAMKMVNRICARQDGVVAEVLVAEGQNVEYGAPLVRMGA